METVCKQLNRVKVEVRSTGHQPSKHPFETGRNLACNLQMQEVMKNYQRSSALLDHSIFQNSTAASILLSGAEPRQAQQHPKEKSSFNFFFSFHSTYKSDIYSACISTMYNCTALFKYCQEAAQQNRPVIHKENAAFLSVPPAATDDVVWMVGRLLYSTKIPFRKYISSTIEYIYMRH